MEVVGQVSLMVEQQVVRGGEVVVSGAAVVAERYCMCHWAFRAHRSLSLVKAFLLVVLPLVAYLRICLRVMAELEVEHCASWLDRPACVQLGLHVVLLCRLSCRRIGRKFPCS
jgi:hypothetical protein